MGNAFVKPPEQADIDNRFAFHSANTDERKAQHESVRAVCWTAATKLAAMLPPGREKALVLTHLEEAMFWSNAALARAKEEN
jgi:hypothetical protein